MKTRQEIKQAAKAAMAEQRGTSIGLTIVFLLVGFVVGFIAGLLMNVSLLLYVIVYLIAMVFIVVMTINLWGEFIKIARGDQAAVGALFSNLSVNFLRKLGGMLWMNLWITLWSFLFVIPGIIKGISYFLTPFILADCPHVTARDALKLSMKITEGHKMEIFVFFLSFIGWMILSALTLYILALVYVFPYMYTACSKLYLELRQDALDNGRISAADLGLEVAA